MSADSVAERQQIRPFFKRMRARDPEEGERVATPLELLFDLCFVVAVAQVAIQLHHNLAPDAEHLHHLHLENASELIWPAVRSYLMVFFAIWWAWMNFTWFASSFDSDDIVYRLLTFVQIVGVLILAAGVAAASEGDFATATIGYAVMRVGLISLWVRAAIHDPESRRMALTYAIGLTIAQIGWLSRLAFDDTLPYVTFLGLVAFELLVPVLGERQKRTTWHPGHISERYGLFTIIVIGEGITAAFAGINSARENLDSSLVPNIAAITGGALMLTFGLWWCYFSHSAAKSLKNNSNLAFLWGYAHFLIFGAVAAIGAGVEVAADSLDSEALVSTTVAGLAIAVPVAVFICVTSLFHLKVFNTAGLPAIVGLAFAAVVLGIGFAAETLGIAVTVLAIGATFAVLVAADLIATNRKARQVEIAAHTS